MEKLSFMGMFLIRGPNWKQTPGFCAENYRIIRT
jgi:hypothetical protein